MDALHCGICMPLVYFVYTLLKLVCSLSECIATTGWSDWSSINRRCTGWSDWSSINRTCKYSQRIASVSGMVLHYLLLRSDFIFIQLKACMENRILG